MSANLSDNQLLKMHEEVHGNVQGTFKGCMTVERCAQLAHANFERRKNQRDGISTSEKHEKLTAIIRETH